MKKYPILCPGLAADQQAECAALIIKDTTVVLAYNPPQESMGMQWSSQSSGESVRDSSDSVS